MRVVAGAVILGAAVCSAQQCTPYKWHADSWQAPPANCSTCSNIVPFYWLRWDAIEANATQAALDAINATSQNDYGSLFSWTLHRDMPSDPADNLFPVGGGPNCSGNNGRDTNFSGIWWDHGAETTKTRLETFLAEYARLGGKCERFVIDAEEWLSNWALLGNPGPPPGCHRQRAAAIANDPRFAAVEPDLVRAGFQLPSAPARAKDPNWLFDAIWANFSQYHVWNNVMLKRSAAYFDEGLWQPLQQYFPGAHLSNYDYKIYNGSASECVPDQNGDLYCQTDLHVRGALNGDVSSPSVYMHFGEGFEDWAKSHHNLTGYTDTLFNAMRWGVMSVRSYVIAATPSPGGSRVPVRPWVAPKSWDGERVNNSAFYDEAIRHMAATGVSDFNFWNYNHNGTDVEVLSALLAELDGTVGCRERVMAFPNCPGAPDVPCPDAIQFRRGFVLSGMAGVGPQGDRRRYRLTVASGSPSDYAVPGPSGGLAFSIPSINTTVPETCNVTLASATVMPVGASGPGVWLDQAAAAPVASVLCA